MRYFNCEESNLNDQFDTLNLRYHAEYEIEVYDDVYWVPVNQLGSTRYSNDMINELTVKSPDEKKNCISSLFEAIQLYQASKFRGVYDNLDVYDNECTKLWQFHKPGYHAVRTNEGCCAANSNWLSYLLHGKYEQIGFFSYSQSDGNGHIMNYIYHNGWYYFIDMMMYRLDSLPFSGIESGTEAGHKDGEYIAGNLHKSRSPLSYIDYCIARHRDTPIFFSMSPQREVTAIGVNNRKGKPLSKVDESEFKNGEFDLLYPESSHAVTLYVAKETTLILRFEKPPVCDCHWEDIPSDTFSNS